MRARTRASRFCAARAFAHHPKRMLTLVYACVAIPFPPPFPPPLPPPPVSPPPLPSTPPEFVTLFENAAAGNVLAVTQMIDDGWAGKNDHSAVPVAGFPKGMTALAFAAYNGHRDVVQALLTRGAEVNDRSPLVLAASGGYTDVVQLLLGAGARVDAFCGISAAHCRGMLGANALQAASGGGHPATVHALLDAGANPLISDMFGATAVIKATHTRDTSKAQYDFTGDLAAQDLHLRAVEVLKILKRIIQVAYPSAIAYKDRKKGQWRSYDELRVLRHRRRRR